MFCDDSLAWNPQQNTACLIELSCSQFLCRPWSQKMTSKCPNAQSQFMKAMKILIVYILYIINDGGIQSKIL